MLRITTVAILLCFMLVEEALDAGFGIYSLDKSCFCEVRIVEFRTNRSSHTITQKNIGFHIMPTRSWNLRTQFDDHVQNEDCPDWLHQYIKVKNLPRKLGRCIFLKINSIDKVFFRCIF